MKEKLIADLNNTKNSSHLIRLIGCGYVALTCGKVALSFFTGDDVSLILMLCAALLTLLALAIALISLWALAKGYSAEYKGTPPWQQPDETESEECGIAGNESALSEENAPDSPDGENAAEESENGEN